MKISKASLGLVGLFVTLAGISLPPIAERFREEYSTSARGLGRRLGWKGVYDILGRDGCNVSMVQEPETSFKEDVAATGRVLALQNGPCILVAHSYGGAVITEVGTDPAVVALVYIAAHMPDAGEKESEYGKRFPSDLAKSGAIRKTLDGFTYIDPGQFHQLFAADLSRRASRIDGALAGLQLRRQLFGDYHRRSVANKAKLDVGSGKGSHHQPRTGTLVRRAR